MRAGDPRIVCRFRERRRRALGREELPEVEHLHAVLAGAVGDDERVVLVHLDAAPAAGVGARVHRQLADVARPRGIGHLHERRAVHPPHDGELPRARAVGPAPDVVELDAAPPADLLERQERQQVHLPALERFDASGGAAALAAGDRREGGRHIGQRAALRPAAVGRRGVQVTAAPSPKSTVGAAATSTALPAASREPARWSLPP